MSYFCDCNFLTREVPQYNHLINFDIVKINLNFSSTRPFYVRHAFKKLLGLIFTSSYYMQEFWEENLSLQMPIAHFPNPLDLYGCDQFLRPARYRNAPYREL